MFTSELFLNFLHSYYLRTSTKHVNDLHA